METISTEQYRASIIADLKKSGIEEKEIEKISGKPVLHCFKKLVCDGAELVSEDDNRFMFSLSFLLEKYFNTPLIYRASSDPDLDKIVERGVDKGGLLPLPKGSETKKGERDIFASRYLSKASEYGHGVYATHGEKLKQNVTVLLYDERKMQEVKTALQYAFIEDPKETLVGILVLHGSESAKVPIGNK